MNISLSNIITTPFAGLFTAMFCLIFSNGSLAENTAPRLKYALKSLATYEELKDSLETIQKHTRIPIQTGPLIKNGPNNGLIDIDVPLQTMEGMNETVCDGLGNKTPTVRDAVLCTMHNAGRGNTDPNRVGQSNQGRELLAVRLGNPSGLRVYVLTQVHGNEPAGTEAALRALRSLTRSERTTISAVLNKLDILMVMRGNPDGGEPDPENCAVWPATAEVIRQDCAFIRQNVDASAGGGFAEDSEAGFSGVVGRGYDLNRYHFVGLDQPIRPVESQAMVAAGIAFKPDMVLDLHGDTPKTDCLLDFSSIVPNEILSSLPSAQCVDPVQSAVQRILSVFADTDIATDKESLTRGVALRVMQAAESAFWGAAGRFSQVQLGAGDISSGASAAYQLIGAGASGWETANFSPELRADVLSVIDGQPVIGVNTGLPDPAFLHKQIQLNTAVLIEALVTLADLAEQPVVDDDRFCEYPLATGLLLNLGEDFWGAAATGSVKMLPIAPEIGVPLFISGACP